jgi:sucrose-6-phosphate hydrolase SacC (GH32 family)
MIQRETANCPATEDFASLHYAPQGEFVKDHSFVFHEGVYHLFSISGTAGTTWRDPGSEERFSHSISEDLVKWEHVGHVLCKGWHGEEDRDKIWAPFVMEHDGLFHMFYTGICYREPGNPNGGYGKRMCHAVSRDLANWEKRPTLPPPPEGISEAQDAHVYHDPETARFYLYCIGGDGSPGVLVRTSDDLETWSPGRLCFRIRMEDISYRSTYPTESPFVMRHGRYVFLLLNDGYAVSDKPDGGFTGFRPYGQRLPGFACEVLQFGSRYLRSAVHGPKGYYRLVMCEMEIAGLEIRLLT